MEYLSILLTSLNEISHLSDCKEKYSVSQIAQEGLGGGGNKVLSVINMRLAMYMQFMRLQFPTH